MSLSFAGYQTRSVRFQDELEASTGELLGATARQTISELPVPSLYRMAELGNAQLGGTRIDAASAKKRITDAGLDGRLTVPDDGVNSEALDILIERKRNEIKRQEVLNRSPGGFGMGAAQLGTAFAASLLDPVNVGLAFVPVVGQARYLRYLANARGVLGRTAVRVGVGAAEGAVGAALVEPLVYAAKTQEQADYDFTDSLLNVAFGTVFGGGLHAVAGGIGDAARALRPAELPPNSAAARVNAMTPLERETPMRTAVAQAMEGKQVDVEAVIPRIPDEERVIQSQVNELIAAREAELVAATQGRDALTVAISGDTQNLSLDLQRAIERRDAIAAEIAVAPQSARRAELIEEQRKAQSIVDSRQGAVDKLNRVRAAENDLEQLRYGRDSAQTIDELVNALPSAQQSGFRRRIEQGRTSGDVRARGSTLTPTAEREPPPMKPDEVRAIAERQASPESEVTADVRASQAADQQLAEQPPAADIIAEQEQLITDQLADLTDVARVAGIDLKEDIEELDELIAEAETYGKAARAAALCGLGH